MESLPKVYMCQTQRSRPRNKKVIYKTMSTNKTKQFSFSCIPNFASKSSHSCSAHFLPTINRKKVLAKHCMNVISYLIRVAVIHYCHIKIKICVSTLGCQWYYTLHVHMIMNISLGYIRKAL